LRGVKTIDTLYEQGLAPIPKSESKQKLVRTYHEKFYWPLSAAILLLLVEIFFPERKREPRPKTLASSEPREALREAMTLLLLLLLPARAFSSPASALREYEAGKYDQALKEYEQLLQRKGDDPRLHFNAGAAAYRNRQFDAAAKQFNEALAAQDLRLQGQAYYNRGNSLYHLGESAPDDAKRMETWQKSLQDYQSALKLNQQDVDAKFNYQFVKKKLEELKQQQQKQDKKDNKDQDKDQNKDQQQQQQNKNQQKQDQQKQDEKKDQDQKSQAEKNKSNKDSAQQNQKSEQEKQEEQKKQDEQKHAEQKQKEDEQRKEKEAQQASAKPKDASDEKDKEEQGQAYAAGQMTPEQARQLLDAQKGDENMLPIKPTGKPVDKGRPVKDW
jgi:Ca-activated chloride channel family protein